MSRLIDLGEDNKYTPMINDLIKIGTVMLVIEILRFYFINDPILDKLFRKIFVFTLIGYSVFYLFVDKIIGAGPICCSLI